MDGCTWLRGTEGAPNGLGISGGRTLKVKTQKGDDASSTLAILCSPLKNWASSGSLFEAGTATRISLDPLNQ